MTRVVLLRHGRTAWNHTGRAQGQADVPLDEEGEAQARAVAPAVAALRPVLLWSSDLARAARTADLVADRTDLEPRLDHRLRERDVGSFSGLTGTQIRERDLAVAEAFFAGEGSDDVESEVDVATRMVEVVEEAADAAGDAAGDGATAVLVSHGWAIRMATLRLLGGDPSDLATLDNCGWAELTRSDEAWTLAAWNRTGCSV